MINRGRWSRIALSALLLVGANCRIPAFEPTSSTCAVLPLEAASGVSRETAAKLTVRVHESLGKTTGMALTVLPLRASHQQLVNSGFDQNRYHPPGTAAIIAGRKLGVDYVLFGRVERRGTREILDLSLIDVDAARYISRIQTYSDADPEGFQRLAPTAAVKAILEKWTQFPPSAPATPSSPSPLLQPYGDEPDWQKAHPAFWSEVATYAHEVDSLMENHLDVGTRSTFYRLIKDHHRHFLGTIEHLDEKQSALPAKLFVAWNFDRFWAVNVTWDRLEVETITSNLGTTDGQIELTGLYVSGVRRFETHTRLTPYASAGLTFFKGHFLPSRWWALGYNTQADWAVSGHPRTSNGGVTQSMSVDNTIGIELAGGCEVILSERWSADVLARYTWVRADAAHKVYRNGQTLVANTDTSSIPFSHLALGVGVRYHF